MSGRIISQGPCPNPQHIGGQHSDAYTTYDDGSAYCFNCHYYVPANKYQSILKEKKEVKTAFENLPEDSIRLAPSWLVDSETNRWMPKNAHLAENWLAQFSITMAEKDHHHMLWSEEKKYLIFPILGNEGNLLAWQARYFGDNPKHPKYVSRGEIRSVLHLLHGPQANVLILVEDLISAIKISRQYVAMPLWGSTLHSNTVKALATMWDSALLWLDYDKRQYSVSTATQNSHLNIKPIITSLDPKYYSDEEIKQIIDDRRTNHCSLA